MSSDAELEQVIPLEEESAINVEWTKGENQLRL